MVSSDQNKVVKHMNEAHSIKVEDNEVRKKFTCSECDYKNSNMNKFKTHMINVHHKGAHEWMTGDIKEGFFCDECEAEFTNKSTLSNHMDTAHDDYPAEVSEEESEHDTDVSFEDFVMENTPLKAKPEKQDGINIKGKSDEFIEASR